MTPEFEALGEHPVFRHFYQISQIPYGSGNEQALSYYLEGWARGLDLEAEQDRITAGNVALDVDDVAPLTGRQKIVLVVFVLGIAFTLWGIVTQGYYIDELAAIFLAIGIIGGVSFKKWAKYLLPLFLMWWVVAFIFLVIAVQIGYGPF